METDEEEEVIRMMTRKEFEELKIKSKLLKEAAEILRVDEKDLPRVLDRFLNEIKEKG